MLPWPGHPLDALAASSDGLLKAVRVSPGRIIQVRTFAAETEICGLKPNSGSSLSCLDAEKKKITLPSTLHSNLHSPL